MMVTFIITSCHDICPSPVLEVPTRDQDQTSPRAPSDPYGKPLPPLPPHRDSTKDSTRPKLAIKPKPTPKPLSLHRESSEESARPKLAIKPKPTPKPLAIKPKPTPTPGSPGSPRSSSPQSRIRPSFLHSQPTPVSKPTNVTPRQFGKIKPETERKMSVDDLRKGKISNVNQGDMQDELAKKLARVKLRNNMQY